MCFGIECVVDGNTLAGPQSFVSPDHRSAAAVCEDEIVARDQCAKRISRVLLYAVECDGRIDVPEDSKRVRLFYFQDRQLEQLIKCSDAACLDQHIGAACDIERPPDPVL